MSDDKRKLVAVHEIRTSKKSKPVPPGKEFSSDQHAYLVAKGAAVYADVPAVNADDDGQGDTGDQEDPGDQGDTDPAAGDQQGML